MQGALRTIAWLLVLGCACDPTGQIGSGPQSDPIHDGNLPGERDRAASQPDDGTLSTQVSAAGATGADAIGAGVSGSDNGSPRTSGEEPGAMRCAGSNPTPGMENRSVTVDGGGRTFLLYTPATLQPDRPMPLVFVHHGFTMSGAVMRDLTAFEKLADQEGIVVAFPDGTAVTPWNVGANICGLGGAVNSAANDFGFFEQMLADIARDHCIDRSRVFMTGFSMGGYFTNHLACKHPGWVRAVAPHSGGTYPEDGCGSDPKPVLILHGSQDMVISYQCGVEARDKWVRHNGCSQDADRVRVQGGECAWYKGCRPGGQVVMCTFPGMGHGWSGGLGLYGGGLENESATRLVWDFFQRS